MIEWLSSWTEGIVVAVIIGTIIEMILPEGNNKKYIKTIIGIYILFTIVVPVINKFTNKSFKLDLSKYEKLLETSTDSINVEETVNTNIQNVYKLKLEENIKEKIKSKNYEVIKIDLDLEFDNSNQYGNIKKINLNVKKNDSKSVKIEKIKPIEIGSKKENEEMKEAISAEERTNLKKYLSEEYQIEEEKIIIF